MNFRFDFHKTLQASGVLLSLDANRMAYVRLLKLLYIADREWLAEAGRTITGDEAVAMKNGPVLSRVYDLIKGVAPRTDDWGDFIRKADYSVELKKDPGRGKLSKGEIEKLTEVADRYRAMDDWELSEHTHEFPEWRNHYQARRQHPDPMAGDAQRPGASRTDRDRRAGRGRPAVPRLPLRGVIREGKRHVLVGWVQPTACHRFVPVGCTHPYFALPTVLESTPRSSSWWGADPCFDP